ncbi:MAG: helix-turn-helix transcriptional regulator [Acidimicrobiales bacterium]
MKPDELGDFLRTRRQRLDPATVGFPAGGNRRTAGLRREELAVLAGVGVSWLTRLEQGRANRVSAEVLHGLASALRMSAVERAHLFSLAGVHLQLQPAEDGEASSATHRRLVEGLNPNPAYVLDHHWNLVVWNSSEQALFPLLADPELEPHPNLLRLFLEQVELQDYIDDWPLEIERLTRQLRAHIADHPSRFLEELIGELRETHVVFNQAWELHDVAPLASHVRVINHPDGQRRFEQHRLGVPDHPGWLLVLFLPVASDPVTGY